MSFKVKQNLEDRYVLERADGTSFSVAKKGLGAGTMQKIQSFAEGGIVEEAAPEVVQPGISDALGVLGQKLGFSGVETTPSNRSMFRGEPVTPQDVQVPGGEAPAPVLAATPTPKEAPPTLEDLPRDPNSPSSATPAADPLKEIVDLKTSSINTTMKAEQKLADDNIRTQNFLLTEQKASQERMQKLTADYDKVAQEQLTAMKTDKISPKTYWSGKNVAEQIGTGIALVLGGLAGGVDKTGKNAAADFLDKKIKQDIEVQKNNLERKDNIFAANLKRYGTLMDAETATKRDLMVSAQAMLEINKNKATSPLAKAKADEALAGLKANVMVLNQQLAMSKSMDPTMAKITKLPEKFQAKAMEEMGTVQQLNQSATQIKQLIKEAHAASRVGAGGSIPGTSNSKVLGQTEAQIRSLLQANWKGPMTDDEAKKLVGPYLSSFTDNEKDADKKADGLIDMIRRNSKPTPTLQGFGLLPKPAFVPTTVPRQPRK